MVLPFVLAVGAVVGVGAAAYSRGVTGSSSAHPSGASPVAANPPAPAADPASSSLAAAAGPSAAPSAAVPGAVDGKALQVNIGQLTMTTDYTGVTQTSLPVTVTNTGPLTHSFDVTIVAIDKAGNKITADTGTAANLRPGQSAQLRVLEIVNDSLVKALATATFQVQSIFTY